jgi:hypothetical protein
VAIYGTSEEGGKVWMETVFTCCGGGGNHGVVLNKAKDGFTYADICRYTFVKEAHKLAEGYHAHALLGGEVVPADADKVGGWLVFKEALEEFHVAEVGAEGDVGVLIELIEFET